MYHLFWKFYWQSKRFIYCYPYETFCEGIDDKGIHEIGFKQVWGRIYKYDKRWVLE